MLDQTGFRVLQLTNESEDDTTSYSISPHVLGTYVASEESFYMATTVWHTHPGGLVGPSSLDIANSIPGVHYLVMSIPDGVATFFGAPRIL